MSGTVSSVFGSRRLVALVLRASPACLSLALLVWTVSANPFAKPFVQASTIEIQRALDRALAGQVSRDWLNAQINAALTTEDWDRIETLQLIAADQEISPGETQQRAIDALSARNAGFLQTGKNCALCMADIAACPSIRLMAGCGVPFELTPFGDVNALRKAGHAVLSGDPVDDLDVALALAGLAGTATLALSGGGSATVKAGTTALRIGRRLGTLTPGFLHVLTRLSKVDFQPGYLLPYLRGRAKLDEVVETARLADLRRLAGNLARVSSNTSLTDTILLLRHVDTAEDAARLARISDAAKTRTRPAFEILGKKRVFRTLVRLSDVVIVAAILIYAVVLHLIVTMIGWAGIRSWRAMARMARRRG